MTLWWSPTECNRLSVTFLPHEKLWTLSRHTLQSSFIMYRLQRTIADDDALLPMSAADRPASSRFLTRHLILLDDEFFLHESFFLFLFFWYLTRIRHFCHCFFGRKHGHTFIFYITPTWGSRRVWRTILIITPIFFLAKKLLNKKKLGETLK